MSDSISNGSNKVILVGKNHHHTLNMARVFGIHGIKTYGIIVGRGRICGFVRRSKYWQKTWGVKDTAEMLEILRREFQGEKLKPVVIPCSDDEATALDNNLDELSKKYILGSFNHEQGRIPQLMDKFSQVEFVKNNLGLKMAESFIINLSDGEIPAGLPFPCLVKPVASVEGKKSDIRKLDDKDSLREYLGVLKAKGYTRILAQRFIDFDYECNMVGCCGDTVSYTLNKIIRRWPVVGGTVCFSQCLDNESEHETCRKTLEKLSSLGYSGMINIEFLSVNKELYINEINWRNGGEVFTCMGTKVFSPLIWYWSVTGQSDKISEYPLTTKDTSLYGMDEQSDIAHVINLGEKSGRLSLREWVRDVKRSCSFAAWYKDDKLPALWGYPRAFLISLLPVKTKEFIKKLIRWK